MHCEHGDFPAEVGAARRSTTRGPFGLYLYFTDWLPCKTAQRPGLQQRGVLAHIYGYNTLPHRRQTLVVCLVVQLTQARPPSNLQAEQLWYKGSLREPQTSTCLGLPFLISYPPSLSSRVAHIYAKDDAASRLYQPYHPGTRSRVRTIHHRTSPARFLASTRTQRRHDLPRRPFFFVFVLSWRGGSRPVSSERVRPPGESGKTPASAAYAR